MNRTGVIGTGLILASGVLSIVYFWRFDAQARPSPLLLIPIVLLLALGATLLGAAILSRRRPPAPPADVTAVWPRTRAVTTVAATSILAVMLCGFGVAFLRWDVLTEWALLETAVLGALLVAVVWIGWINLRRAAALPAAESAPIQHLLQHEPEKIVWAYKIVVAATPTPGDDESLDTVCLWLRDGRSHQTTLPPADAQQLLDLVQARAPHATIGYDAGLEVKYLQDSSTIHTSPS